MQKSLDRKLASIHADPSGSPEFILADAKDADMAFGIGAPGLSPERHDGELRHKTLAEYREQIRQIIDQGLVDIMLMSASTCDQLAIQERRFEQSAITPAARANDATDVHVPRGGRVYLEPAHPFRTAAIDHLQCGHLDCSPIERRLGANLGLYSVTFNNRLDLDLHTLEKYKEFREEAERKGFRHFLEVFDPNQAGAIAPEQLGGFINDLIARTLAGVAQAGRPVFLKIVYHGPKAMEELVRYDPHLVVGVLGGAAGTTLDAFKLLEQVKKYGARAALFGRKINQAENQLAFIEFLRLIADGVLTAEEACQAYHGVLQKLGITPQRSLAEDMQLRTNVMSYAGGSQATVPETVGDKPSEKAAATDNAAVSTSASNQLAGPKFSTASAAPASQAKASGPNFAAMTPAERLAYHRSRLGLPSNRSGNR
jgi:hypothetical protein